LLKPEYNILPIAGSSLGYKHTEESKAKISKALKGHKGGFQPRSQKIEVTDIELNTSTIYNSIGAAARALNITQSRISLYFNRNQIKPLNGRYVVRKV
jgi:hypothetical protein